MVAELNWSVAPCDNTAPEELARLLVTGLASVNIAQHVPADRLLGSGVKKARVMKCKMV